MQIYRSYQIDLISLFYDLIYFIMISKGLPALILRTGGGFVNLTGCLYLALFVIKLPHVISPTLFY